ncbi:MULTISPECIES: xanthine dehydrogenase family protein subunit M [Oxalobacteraceae]|uniref:FAD binding domain-containing protein n=1 Tax=Herminiimonas sp. Marseille-P9896 TaxID=2742211 RepID=UPI0015891332|nr:MULTISPECIES: FAD binding domain-containing protein [Oxalobacteraceae]
MKPSAYSLIKADDLAQASAQLAENGWGSKPVAGCQSLGAMLNLRLAQPESLLDLDAFESLRAVTDTGDAIRFGAMTTHAAIEDQRVPDPSQGLMPYVARGIAYRAVRNRGTLGGSLCHADPAADWISTMPLLGATLHVLGPSGQRDIAARDFMTSAYETQLVDGEILVAVSVPKRTNTMQWSYRKLCRKTGELSHAMTSGIRDSSDGTERVVIGALDGAPFVVERAGLMTELLQGAVREQIVRQAAPELELDRRHTLMEMLRLVALDMGKTR